MRNNQDLSSDYKPKRGKGARYLPGYSGNPKGRTPDTVEKKIMKKATKEVQKKIMAYLEEHGLNAAMRINDLGENARQEIVRLGANKDILDRIGIGIKNPNVALGVQINFNEDKEEFK